MIEDPHVKSAQAAAMRLLEAFQGLHAATYGAGPREKFHCEALNGMMADLKASDQNWGIELSVGADETQSTDSRTDDVAGVPATAQGYERITITVADGAGGATVAQLSIYHLARQ